MARIQNERDASEELNFRIQTVDGEVRNPTIKDEFMVVIKEFKIPVEKVFIDSILEEFFSKTSKMAKVQIQICGKKDRYFDQTFYKHSSLWFYH